MPYAPLTTTEEKDRADARQVARAEREADAPAPAPAGPGNQAAARLLDPSDAIRVSAPEDHHEREATSIASVLASKLDPSADALGARPDRLPPSVVGVMRSELGADVSRVPLRHSPAEASTIDARAFTLGGAIHLGAEARPAHTHAGRHDLLHEAVHAVQQGAAPVAARAGAPAVTPAPAGVAHRLPGAGGEETKRNATTRLGAALAKPAPFAVFLEWCATEYSLENPMFWGTLQLYKRAPSAARASIIYNTFVADGAAFQINLPSYEKRALDDLFGGGAVPAGDAAVFDDAEVSIRVLMKDSMFRLGYSPLAQEFDKLSDQSAFRVTDLMFGGTFRSGALSAHHKYEGWMRHILARGTLPAADGAMRDEAKSRLERVSKLTPKKGEAGGTRPFHEAQGFGEGLKRSWRRMKRRR